MIKKNLFFDLDGTLIDSTDRVYKLFNHLTPRSNFSYDEYLELKRQQIDHPTILKTKFGYSEDSIIQFQHKWMQNIEESCWLQLDKPFEGVTEMLENLSLGHSLFIVTNRQHNYPVYEQIKRFRWKRFFTDVFITNQKKDKAISIMSVIKVNKSDWFIGDTEVDVQQGKLLGVRTAAVLSGFRNKESLLKYEPDIIVSNVLDVPY